jgi:RimJ/RimL family protein N-acetyltransferase
MNFPENYRALQKNKFTHGDFSIVPIRPEHRFEIMQWRNEQIYHLRQNKVLTPDDQELYFSNVVLPLFSAHEPGQFLYSYFYKGVFCGYGGLVHINRLDSYAEISFLMNAKLEANEFEMHWTGFLKLIEELAFFYLKLNKIFTYAYDLRPLLYPVLLALGFSQDARLREHVWVNDRRVDVLIHSKLNPELYLLLANETHLQITYQWASNEEVRRFSFNTTPIEFEEHQAWFTRLLERTDIALYILYHKGEPVGSIRFNFIAHQQAMISYLVDPRYFGKGLGTRLLDLGEQKLRTEFPEISRIFGEVVPSNMPSVKIFRKLRYQEDTSEQRKLVFYKNLTT